MATYADTRDIEARYKKIELTADTAVSENDVVDWLNEHTATINGRINSVYVTPVVEATSPEAFKILRRICVYMTVADSDEVLGQGLLSADEVGRAETYRERADDMLDDIAEGRLSLVDGVVASTATRFHNQNVTDGVKPVIKKDVVQW